MVWEEIASLLITAFASVLKDVLEDAITGKILIAPRPVITAEPDPSINVQAENVIDQWNKDHP